MCKRMLRCCWIYFTIIVFMAAGVPVSFAQEEQVTGEQIAKIENPAKAEDKPGNVTIDFKDADISNVLRILSLKSGVNIVAGKDVQGTVTIRLVNVPWEKALDVVLKTYGFAYERDGNIIRVTTLENLGQEPLKTEVFSISYSKADELAEAIKDMVTERGNIRADQRSNTIIVTDIPTNIHKIGQIIERLDEPTPQVYISTRVIETTLDDDEKLGIDWNFKITATGSKIPTTLPFDKDFKGLDALNDKFIPLGDPAATDPAFRGSTAPGFPYTLSSNVFSFGTLDFSELNAILWLLDTRTDTKIVSNPRTVTLNNQKATIHIGTSIYVPKWEESSTTGAPVFSGITKTELDTGIMLSVTPHVNSKDEIVVDLEPTISTLGNTAALLTDSAGRTINYFPVSIRTVKTQVRIKDGQTIAIGGLLKEETVKRREKIPFLGDIPLFGHLFRYSEDRIDTRDLLIFVTVKLVEDGSDARPFHRDIIERMDKFEHTSSALGHQYEPNTPIGTEKKKKQFTKLLVE